MALINDPSARMQIRSRGELTNPGVCMVCGSGNCDEGYLDLGVFYDFEGHMYLCYLCLTQAGETIGMFTPEQVESQQSQLAELLELNIKYREEFDRVQPIISAFERIILDTPNLVVGPVVSNDETAESIADVTIELADSSSNVSFGPSEGGTSGEPEPAKPVKSGKRSSSVSVAERDIKF